MEWTGYKLDYMYIKGILVYCQHFFWSVILKMTVEEFIFGSKSVILTLFHEGIMWLLKLDKGI